MFPPKLQQRHQYFLSMLNRTCPAAFTRVGGRINTGITTIFWSLEAVVWYNNDLTENYISVLRYWQSPPSLPSLAYPTPFQWLSVRSHSCSPHVPLVLSFYLSRRVRSPSLQQHIHKHIHEKRPFFCCQSRKFGNAGARLIRAGSHEAARSDSVFLLARSRLLASGEIERRAEDISRGFDPRSTKVGHRRRREDFSD